MAEQRGVLAELERWAPLAHDTMAVLDETPEAVRGKPWDYADYVRVSRLDGQELFLEVEGQDRRTSGHIKGLVGVHAQAHPWGTALVLQGPLRWVGTRTLGPRGLVKLAAELLPALGQPTSETYDAQWPQIVLVLPCAWSP
jgi:hypothetical protein